MRRSLLSLSWMLGSSSLDVDCRLAGNDAEIHARPLTPSRGRPGPRATGHVEGTMPSVARTVIAAFGCAAAIEGCYFAHEIPPEPPIGDAREASVSEELIAMGSCPSLSDDGRWLTYVEDSAALDPSWATLMDLSTGERVEIAWEDPTSCLVISGDGATIVFSTVEGLVIIDRATLARTTEPIPFVGWPSISDDGTRIAYQLCRGPVASDSCKPLPRVLDRRTGTTTAIWGPSPNYMSPHWVALSGDGESVTYEGSIPDGSGRMDTFVARVDARVDARPLGLPGGYHRFTGISDDGRVVATQTDGEWAPEISGVAVTRGLDLILMEDGVAAHDLRATEGDMWGVWLMAMSGDGETIVFTTRSGLVEGDRSDTRDVFRMRAGERTPERLARCDATTPPALSDDGETIVVSVSHCADGRYSVEGRGLLLFRSI